MSASICINVKYGSLKILKSSALKKLKLFRLCDCSSRNLGTYAFTYISASLKF